MILARTGPRVWIVAAEAVATLVVARTLWTWRDDPYVFLADVPYMTGVSIGLAVSLALTLLLVSRAELWPRRVGWSLTAVRVGLLPAVALAWCPAMSPYVSLW
ncbi:hypothetical protein [Streptomyces sp. G1]|uniref:hypothetical protein n=1 Tax=Streptomyces sp. G1 TaxID=361572 RepID=UPI00202FDB2E|nr:hypothetical protein [Streptomyces sp. G1]MCM1973533.1 hypothetical protein [Streptomyces sp. G1]